MTTATAAPSNSVQSAAKPAPVPRNGVDVPALFATLGAVRQQPELAAFTFRATNRWQKGTHSRSRMETFTGAGGDHQHVREFEFDGDHPAPLCGADQGPTPVEFLLHALLSCLTAGIGNIAAARGVDLDAVESSIEGDINLVGLLGIDTSVRNGYSALRVNFKISGDAPAEKLRQIVEQSKARSAVFDVITNQVPVSIDVEVA
jgi:uncharacterized OsmC-like protein